MPPGSNNNNLYLLPLAIRITVILQLKFKTLNIIYTYQIKFSLAPLGINDCLCLTVRDTGILRCAGILDYGSDPLVFLKNVYKDVLLILGYV